ncbi:hypothetical protein DENSPDRAFT_885605 [Dentipellis sp. KUC8613]|nr:hypothetical protein DENSPDRAFT_885605 [Dentipellis sp. KUC8613]
MADRLNDSIVALGHDLFAQKLYYVATCALWTYDYFLTLGDEITYAWSGRKTYIFYLFLANRYLMPCTILVSLVCHVLPPILDCGCVRSNFFRPPFRSLTKWPSCTRYGPTEGFETAFFTTIAQIFLTLRVYAITGRQKIVLVISVLFHLCQWGIIIYILSQASPGTSNPALLLSHRDSALPPLPTLPDVDAFHICIFIAALNKASWLEATVCMCLAFDTVVFLIICIMTGITIRRSSNGRMLRIIQRDGVVYFFVLFSTNLVWLLLALHAPPGLKFVQNQSTMIISSIMITRITLNLKRSSHQSVNYVPPWSVKTFEDHDTGSSDGTPGIVPHESHELYDLRNGAPQSCSRASSEP